MNQAVQTFKNLLKLSPFNGGQRIGFPTKRGHILSTLGVVALFPVSSVFIGGGVAVAQSATDPIPAAAQEPAQQLLQVTLPENRKEPPNPDLSASAVLPDAPVPVETTAEPTFESRSGESSGAFDRLLTSKTDGSVISRRPPGYVSLDQCPDDVTNARSCRIHWHQLVLSTAAFNAFQNVGNLYTGYWYRWETSHGVWFQRWINSAAGWRWNVWNDQNPFLDDYIAHPMMGGITNYLWIQNDPKGMTVEFGNTPEYWHSRMRAFAFSTAYSFQWKLGPFGEAGIGHNGDHPVPQSRSRVWTNETGWVELVTTPVGGLLWTMAEDALDKHVVKKVEEKPRGALPLLLISFLTPARATANIFRFRPPWYRDDRIVRNSSFWSEPRGNDDPV